VDIHNTYADDSFTLISIHTPEFSHEKVVNNVRNAVERLGLPYPVAIDNDFKIWRSFGNRAWPTLYLIDRQGDVRLAKVGEGRFGMVRGAIEYLKEKEA
jgi:alkyl hydroperoxide reductase subunit AhpC